jgi:hypothetical protein
LLVEQRKAKLVRWARRFRPHPGRRLPAQQRAAKKIVVLGFSLLAVQILSERRRIR